MDEKLVTSLKEAIKDMDIPEMRKNVGNMADVRWIGRNMGIRNSSHPNFDQARGLLRQLGAGLVI